MQGVWRHLVGYGPSGLALQWTVTRVCDLFVATVTTIWRQSSLMRRLGMLVVWSRASLNVFGLRRQGVVLILCSFLGATCGGWCLAGQQRPLAGAAVTSHACQWLGHCGCDGLLAATLCSRCLGDRSRLAMASSVRRRWPFHGEVVRWASG